jgi:NAD(P)-dependent dehydrogenase (short-subunit alcohol dehydrogenase family)
MDLKGKVAIVTGGNGGLGQCICHALAKAGCDMAVVYARSREPALAVAGHLRRSGVRAEAFACDLTDPASIEQLAAQVEERFGRIDVLVNDAAYNKWIPFPDLDALTLEAWHKILSVNLTGPMLLIKAAAPAMRRAGRPDRQHRIGRRPLPVGIVDRLRGVEGGAHPPHALHGGRAGAAGPGQLHRPGLPGGHARDVEPGRGLPCALARERAAQAGGEQGRYRRSGGRAVPGRDDHGPDPGDRRRASVPLMHPPV